MATVENVKAVSPLLEALAVQKAAPPTEKNSVKDTPENLKKVSQEFESFLIYYMMKEMRKTVPQTSLLNGGRAEEIFQGMLDEQLSLQMSKAGGIGLAPMLYQQLSRYIQQPGGAVKMQMPVSAPAMPDLDLNLNDE